MKKPVIESGKKKLNCEFSNVIFWGGLPVCAVKDVHGGHGEPLCKLRDHLPGFGLISHFEHFAWNLQNCFPCSIFSPGQKLISVVGDGSLLLHCGAQGCECRGVLEIKHKDSQLI